MKYIVFIALPLLIILFSISCDYDSDSFSINTTTLATASLTEIESIVSSINTNHKATNRNEWHITELLHPILTLTGQETSSPNNADPCSPRAGLCGVCPGFCENINATGDHVIKGSINNSPFTSHDYRAGRRLVSIGIVRNQQTGKEKVLIDFTHGSSFLKNDALYLKNDSQLFAQLTTALHRKNITLLSGIYPATYHTNTGNPQTIVDAIIH